MMECPQVRKKLFLWMLLLKSKLERKKHATYTPLPLFDENQHQNLRSRSMPKLFETSSSYKTNCFRPMARTFMDKMLETCECSYRCFTCVHICDGFVFCVWNMNIKWYNISPLWHGLRKYICRIQEKLTYMYVIRMRSSRPQPTETITKEVISSFAIKFYLKKTYFLILKNKNKQTHIFAYVRTYMCTYVCTESYIKPHCENMWQIICIFHASHRFPNMQKHVTFCAGQ